MPGRAGRAGSLVGRRARPTPYRPGYGSRRRHRRRRSGSPPARGLRGGSAMQGLARINRTQAFLGALALVLVGLFAPGWYGGAILFALVAVLLALMARTAPATRPGAAPAPLPIPAPRLA